MGNLDRKSRPPKSIAEPLSKLLKDFKVVIQEFSQFSECVRVSMHVLVLTDLYLYNSQSLLFNPGTRVRPQ